jgi:hypothetical protein
MPFEHWRKEVGALQARGFNAVVGVGVDDTVLIAIFRKDGLGRDALRVELDFDPAAAGELRDLLDAAVDELD